jgi:hypothetical protein
LRATPYDLRGKPIERPQVELPGCLPLPAASRHLQVRAGQIRLRRRPQGDPTSKSKLVCNRPDSIGGFEAAPATCT